MTSWRTQRSTIYRALSTALSRPQPASTLIIYAIMEDSNEQRSESNVTLTPYGSIQSYSELCEWLAKSLENLENRSRIDWPCPGPRTSFHNEQREATFSRFDQANIGLYRSGILITAARPGISVPSPHSVPYYKHCLTGCPGRRHAGTETKSHVTMAIPRNRLPAMSDAITEMKEQGFELLIAGRALKVPVEWDLCIGDTGGSLTRHARALIGNRDETWVENLDQYSQLSLKFIANLHNNFERDIALDDAKRFAYNGAQLDKPPGVSLSLEGINWRLALCPSKMVYEKETFSVEYVADDYAIFPVLYDKMAPIFPPLEAERELKTTKALKRSLRAMDLVTVSFVAVRRRSFLRS